MFSVLWIPEMDQLCKQYIYNTPVHQTERQSDWEKGDTDCIFTSSPLDFLDLDIKLL